MAKFRKCSNCDGKGFLASGKESKSNFKKMPFNKLTCPFCYGKGSKGLHFNIIKRFR